jgi:uncharacterized protein DUF998
MGLSQKLLACGVVAGPIYVAVGVIEMLTRSGFDLRRHTLSLLSNGDLGWIHSSLFVATGVLVFAGAVGIRRVLRGDRGGTWGPILLGAYGFGLIGAGFFSADPALGFPPGTPADARDVSWHGLLHFICGGVGFIGLIAACIVFARRFAEVGERGWATYSVLTGVLFFAAFFGIAAGSSQGEDTVAVVNVAFFVAAVLGWAWISAVTARLRREIV